MKLPPGTWRKMTNLSVGVLLLLILYLTSYYSYLLFHVLVELVSVVIAWGIFMVAANSWHFHQNEYLSFIGIAYLFVGGFDLLHTLTYKGMGVLQGYDTNLPTQLWVLARYMESLSLALAPLFLRRKLKPHLVSLAYAATTGLLLVSLFTWETFPACYVEGQGLTLFKQVSEGIIVAILLGATIVLFRRRQEFDSNVFRALVASIVASVCAELAFTFYVNVYGTLNLLGHFLKLASYYLIYKAFVETGLVQPYDLLFRNLKQSEEALRGENDELDAFAHTVAHDLKTPLSLVMGFADLLQADEAGLSREERQRYLRTIVQNSRRMSNIINELLLLARVRRHTVEMVPLDMSTIVSEALHRLHYAIEDSRAEIATPQAWPIALGHAAWVEEIWVNYISNAIKYGGQPPQIELGSTIQPSGMVRFWIRDNGKGISPQDQARLFTPFTKLAQVDTKGQGLGLSIVRRIAAKLGGQVGVESTEGIGSTFFFEIPGAANP